LNVVGDKVVFSTAASLSSHNVIFPKTIDALAAASSEIFMLPIDWKERRFIIPSRPLEPLYKIEGFSILATTSEDGTRVAFLNQRFTAGISRYNLVVATSDGAILKYIDATTWSFSLPAFVGMTVLANQIFEDRYETTLADLASAATRKDKGIAPWAVSIAACAIGAPRPFSVATPDLDVALPLAGIPDE
jgi:hypothetical protein